MADPTLSSGWLDAVCRAADASKAAVLDALNEPEVVHTISGWVRQHRLETRASNGRRQQLNRVQRVPPDVLAELNTRELRLYRGLTSGGIAPGRALSAALRQVSGLDRD